MGIRSRALPSVILFVVVVALLALPNATPAQAAGEQWLVTGRLATGCLSGDSGFSIQFVNLDPAKNYFADTIVKDNAGVVYMDEFIGPAAGNAGFFDNDWYIFDENVRGLQTGSWPLPAGQSLVLIVTLRDAAQAQIFQTVVRFTCDANDFALQSAGCDSLVASQPQAVGGLFVADAPVYWAADSSTTTGLVVQAGKTYLVTGQDTSGQYRQILLQCQFVWVPANTVGPNPDNVWQGRPLPTTIVK